MENFVVSARKYRPATFASVIGQEHITHTLKNAIRQQQLAHAFLFCGPRGVGKTTCARILAKTINCQNITPDFEACNECDSCKAFNGNASFNIYELDAASNNSVEDIRGLVDQVRYPPQGAKYKIYIIDEVHMLSAAAFNAFLKTLEEPPPYAKFILATTERHKILPTILSRCQVFDFHRIKIEDAVRQLRAITAKEGIEAEDEALHIIAQKADGAMRDALSIFDRIVSASGKKISYKDVISNLNILDYEYYFRAVNMMITKDLPGMLLLFDEVLSNGFDAQHFLNGFSDHIRNLMMCRYPGTVKLLEVAESVAARFMQQAQQCSSTLLLNALNLVNRCDLEYKGSKNPRLHVELTLMKLCHITSVIDLKSEAASGDKKKIPDGNVAEDDPADMPSAVGAAKIANDVTADVVAADVPSAVGADTTAADNTSAPVVSEPPPPPIKTPPKPIPGFGNAGRGSALDKLKQLVNENRKNAPIAETVVETLTEEPDEMLDEARFTAVWEEYLSRLEEQGKRSLMVVYKIARTEVLNGETVRLTLSSVLEREMFEEDRINLMPFLRGRLKHRTLEIETAVNASVAPKKAFTAEDKFRVMAEKYPMLHDLRNALGLELE